jgi:hypothetical protein
MTVTLVRLNLHPAFQASMIVTILVGESDEDAMLEIQSGSEVETGSVPHLIANELVGFARSAVGEAGRFRSGIDGIVVEISIEIDGKLSMEGRFCSPRRGSSCARLVKAVSVAAASLLLRARLEQSISGIQGYFQ